MLRSLFSKDRPSLFVTGRVTCIAFLCTSCLGSFEESLQADLFLPQASFGEIASTDNPSSENNGVKGNARETTVEESASASDTTSQKDSVEPEVGKKTSVESKNLPPAKKEHEDSRSQDSLSKYLAAALENHPSIEASYERWQASLLRISIAKKLPDPTLSFGFFIRSIETRVGPQRARLGIQQRFPWPSTLNNKADSAASKAKAKQRMFEAQALAVALLVKDAYWTLWEIQQSRVIHEEHLQILKGLSESVRGRLVTGSADLAEQQQIDLRLLRLEEELRSLAERESQARSMLSSSIGRRSKLDQGTFTTSTNPSDEGLPKHSLDELISLSRQHPMVRAFDDRAQSEESLAKAKNAERYPAFAIGADWIITQRRNTGGLSDDGKDAVIVGGAISLPLWQKKSRDDARAAKGEARAQRAEQRVLMEKTGFEIERIYSQLRNSKREIVFHRNTLLPQAEATYAAVLGAYAAGRANIAQLLLSQQDLLELRLGVVRTQARHARSWARLENLVGQELSSSSGGVHEGN